MLGVVRVEDWVGEERGGALEGVWDLAVGQDGAACQRQVDGFAGAAPVLTSRTLLGVLLSGADFEKGEQGAEVFGGFVERDGDRRFVEESEIDAGLRGARDQCGCGFVFRSDADCVEEGAVMHGVAGIFEGLGEIGGVAVGALGDAAKSFGAVINGIHRGHHGE